MQKLDSRLRTALKYLRHGRTLADIGTDHAYLPIYAVEYGYSERAIASDINEGPTERARTNVALHSLTERITVVRCDGLCGIEKYDPDDIAIFGMGGELIARIIEDAPWVKSENKRLILQPMTNADTLRKYLCGNRFTIIEETLSEQSGKLYVTLCCEWTGEEEPPLTEVEAILGRYNLKHNLFSPIFVKLTGKAVNSYRVRIEGYSRAGKTSESDEKILSELEKISEMQNNEVKNENP